MSKIRIAVRSALVLGLLVTAGAAGTGSALPATAHLAAIKDVPQGPVMCCT